MNDYIKREDAVERVAFELMYEAAIAKGLSYKELFEHEAEIQERVKMYVQKWLEQVPSADVVEVKHGKWIKATDDGVWSYADAYAECDQCHKVIFNGWSMNYCPNCGAKMDGERKE